MRSSEIRFYVDTMIVEAVLGTPAQYKQAGIVTDLLSKVQEYVGAHIKPDDKVGSLMNLIAPGVVSMGFKALGLGWLGMLIGLAMSVFHIDVGSIISSIWDKLKGPLTGDKQVTSQQVDAAVTNAVNEHAGPPEEGKTSQSFEDLMQDAYFLRLAMEEYERQTLRLTHDGKMTKQAQDIFSLLSGKKAKTQGILTRILGWIFKVALASAGLMVAGDAINKFLGHPNAFDKTYQAGKETPEPAAPAAPSSTQTKYQSKGDGPIPATLPIPNTPASIEAQMIQYAKDVYNGLDGKENVIINSPAFQTVKDDIVWYNSRAAGSNLVVFPKLYTSKKRLVDLFIDDVAERDK